MTELKKFIRDMGRLWFTVTHNYDYIAMDADGNLFLSKEKPTINLEFGTWWNNNLDAQHINIGRIDNISLKHQDKWYQLCLSRDDCFAWEPDGAPLQDMRILYQEKMIEQDILGKELSDAFEKLEDDISLVWKKLRENKKKLINSIIDFRNDTKALKKLIESLNTTIDVISDIKLDSNKK